MSDKIKIELGPIQKTLLIPLWGRAQEYEKPQPIIKDKLAHDIISRLDFDFSKMAASMPAPVQYNTAVRAYHLDRELKKLIGQYPDATIVNLGAGLDTTFWRIDNGHIHWYDLDMPDSIALRKQLLPEGERNKLITASAFDGQWYGQVKERASKVIFIAAGVFVYFEEEQVKKLLLELADNFPGADIIFEIYSKQMLKLREKAVDKQGRAGGMLEQMKWGIGSGRKIARWSKNIKLVEQFSFYRNLPSTPENKELMKKFWLVNLFGWFKIVHLRFK